MSRLNRNRVLFFIGLAMIVSLFFQLDSTGNDLPSFEDAETRVQVFVSPISPGEQFRVFFYNAPGNKKDWIALYRLDDPDDQALSQKYLNGEVNGEVFFTAPDREGAYEFRLFAGGVGTHLTRSNVVEVLIDRELDVTGWIRQQVAGIHLDVPKNWLAIPPEQEMTGWFHEGGTEPDMAFTLTFSRSLNELLDEVDILEQDEVIVDGRLFTRVFGSPLDDFYRIWLWFSTEEMGRGGHLILGGLSFASHYFRAKPVFRHMVESIVFEEDREESVLTDSASLSVFPRVVAPGGFLTVTVSEAPGRFRDWVGLYPAEGTDQDYLAWDYLKGKTDASFNFPAPELPGEYEFRLYSDDSYVLLATSNPVTIREMSDEAGIR